MNLEWLPDLYRYRKSELPREKVVLGGIVVTLICFVILLITTGVDQKSWENLATTFFYVQAIIWLIAASSQTSGAVSSERSERTWDFQRLTPLTSLQTALGKLLGAPIFMLVMGALVIPWSAYAAFRMGVDGGLTFFTNQLTLIVLAFLCNSLGLLISSLTTVGAKKSSMALAPILGLGILWVYAFFTAVRFHEERALDVHYYSQDISAATFVTASAFAFGLWTFLAAKWQIGRDYLEPRRAWRNPAFLIFITLYMAGFDKNFLLTYGFTYLLFFIYAEAANAPEDDSTTLLSWFAALREKRKNVLHQIPFALSAWLTYTIIVIVACVYYQSVTPIALIVFGLRDLSFLESARFFKFKQARMLAATILILVYFLPILLSKVMPMVLLIFAPLPFIPTNVALGTDANLALNLQCGVGQALLAVSLLIGLNLKRQKALRKSTQ